MQDKYNMQKHTRNFLQTYKYGEQDFIPCAICGAQAVDIHHIQKRSAMGSDEVDNLIALCRNHHDQAELRQQPYLSKEQCLEYRQKFHDNRIKYLQENYLLKKEL